MVYLTTERQDLFDVGMMIAIRIDVSGRASEEQIRDAFDRAVRSHEILGMHIVIGEDGRAWYEQGRSAQSLSFTDKTQEDIIHHEERRRFRLEDGELLRAFCMGLTEDGFSMLFCMHHLGGDGKSLLYFAETFLKALNGEEPEHTPMRWPDLGSLPKDSYLPFLGKMLVDSYNRRWSKQRQIFGFDDMDRAYDTFWSTHRTYIHEISYDRDETKELVSQAKSCGVSFTAYITAVMLSHMAGRRSVGYAVNGRQDGNRAMGDQATGISIDYAYDVRKSLADNARRIHRLMRSKLDDPMRKWFVLHFMGTFDGTLLDAVDLEAAGAYTSPLARSLADITGYGRKKKDLSITDLTVADIDTSYGGYTVERAAFIQPAVSYGKNIIGMVTANGRMTVAVHCYEDMDIKSIMTPHISQ